MNTIFVVPAVDAAEASALAVAVEQSKGVTERVQACAADLGSANSIVKQTLAEGATEFAADLALANSLSVETEVQQCANDLHAINGTLAQGVVDLQRTEKALALSQESLAQSEAALELSQAAEKEARREATHDAATGLPNRGHFDSRLEQALASAKRHGFNLAVMYLDLDGFKAINDCHGHAAGDVVLKDVARRLQQHCREEDTVCRNGGDEFLYLLVNPRGTSNVERIARALLKTLATPIDIGDMQLAVQSSLGIAIYPDDGDSGDELIEIADAAMYAAKRHPDKSWSRCETARPASAEAS